MAPVLLVSAPGPEGPRRGLVTSVCVVEWQSFWGEESSEEGGVTEVMAGPGMGGEGFREGVGKEANYR